MVAAARRFLHVLICFAALGACAAAQQSLVASDWTIYITNDACSDYTWGFDEQQTRKAFADVIAAHLDEMNLTDGQPTENRDRYNLSITQEGSVFLEYYPARKAEFLRRIHEGRISVGAFLNNNLWGFQSLESELRDLYPARRMEEDWGISIRAAQHIEEPALPWGAASLLGGSGFKWLVVPFLDYDSTFSQLDIPVFFRLTGPDGSEIRVLMDKWASEKANYAQGRYLLKDPRRIADEWLPHYNQQAYPLKVILASGTHSDNGPGISALTPGFADGIIQYNAGPAPHAKLINATLPQFLEQVDQAEAQHPFMPSVRGDFGQAWDVWPVTLADFAMGMRSGERSFLAGEALLAVAGRTHPELAASTKSLHRDAEWNLTMLADHAWNGKGPANANVNANLRKNWSLQLAQLSAKMQEQAWQANGLVRDSSNVTLFNSLSTARAELVSLAVPASVNGVKGLASQVVDEQGQRMLYFVSPPMPGFSFASLSLLSRPPRQALRKMLKASPFGLESPFYRLRIDPETGGIASLIDQSNQFELRVPGQKTIGQTMFFNGQEHVLEHVRSEIVAQGPVLARIKVTGTIQEIEVTNYVTVYAELDRVDLDIRIHQPVSTEEHRVTQSFPLMGPHSEERIETTGAVVRPFPQPAGDLLPGANPKQFAVQGFVDTSTQEGGVTIAPLDAFVLRQDLGPITFEAAGNDQNYKEGTRDQHGVTDFRLRYSLRAHHTGYDGAAIFPWSRSVATPILAQLGTVPAAVLNQPVVEVDPSRAIATAFKPADGAGNLIRIWETSGKAGPISIAVPGYQRAIRTDLLERDLEPLIIEQGKIRLPITGSGFTAVRLLP